MFLIRVHFSQLIDQDHSIVLLYGFCKLRDSNNVILMPINGTKPTIESQQECKEAFTVMQLMLRYAPWMRRKLFRLL